MSSRWLLCMVLAACGGTAPTATDPVPVAPDAAGAVVATVDAGADATPPSAQEASQTDLAIPEPVCPQAPDGMACVPGATFERGRTDDDHACDQDHQPEDRKSAATPAARVRVDSFFMDLTEVTVEAYTACVRAGRCPNSGPVYADYRAPRQPITGVPWFDARDFCAWQGKRLPTEAEWELAARGPDAEVYPWGDAPADCDRAVVMDARGRSCGEIKRRGKNPEKGRVLEVGSRPAGRYGLFDMMGNAEEWVADWWTPSWDACGEACLNDNPKGPCEGADACPGHEFKSVRGGSWYWPAEHATGYHRRRHHPNNTPFHHFGFRCAKSLNPE